MAEISGPTRYGSKPGFIQTAFGLATDPIANQLATRSTPQQLAQLGTLGQALGRLTTGFNAPSIAPAAREARRQYLQETVPQLMEQFAGGGSQGALLRGIQGAGSDLESKLGALQMQQQFELQKQRQEQLPRLMELGLAPSFQTILTDMPIKPEYTIDPKTGERKYAQVTNLPVTEQIARSDAGGQLIHEAQHAGEDIANIARQGIRTSREIGRGVGALGSDIIEAVTQKGLPKAIAGIRSYGGPRSKAALDSIANYVRSLIARSKGLSGSRKRRNRRRRK